MHALASVRTCMPPIKLGVPLVMGEVYVSSIDDHHNIPIVLLGVVDGLILALQYGGYLLRQATDNLHVSSNCPFRPGRGIVSGCQHCAVYWLLMKQLHMVWS